VDAKAFVEVVAKPATAAKIFFKADASGKLESLLFHPSDGVVSYELRTANSGRTIELGRLLVRYNPVVGLPQQGDIPFGGQAPGGRPAWAMSSPPSSADTGRPVASEPLRPRPLPASPRPAETLVTADAFGLPATLQPSTRYRLNVSLDTPELNDFVRANLGTEMSTFSVVIRLQGPAGEPVPGKNGKPLELALNVDAY
jgi:hypothetical protein